MTRVQAKLKIDALIRECATIAHAHKVEFVAFSTDPQDDTGATGQANASTHFCAQMIANILLQRPEIRNAVLA